LVEELVRPPMRLGARQLVEPPEHPEVLAPRQVLIDGGELAGKADDVAKLLRLADDVEPGDGRVAGDRPQEGGQDPHGRGLARAVRAEQAEHGALVDRQVDAIEGPDLALAGPVDPTRPSA
jgi:hypothetical protein